MIVTAVKEQVKNKDRVSVFVDSKYSFSLTISDYLDHKIKIGMELDEAELKRYKKLGDEGKLRQRTLEWLLNRPHSERELRDYIYRKKVEKEQIDQLVEFFKQKGYQNDEKFAIWFAENRLRKNKSWRAVEAELKFKGVSTVTIQGIASVVGGQQNDQEALNKLVEKLLTRSRYQDEKKLIAYLISKGFSYSLIKEKLKDR
ncbi:MAG: RecX family transcriptional regulator [bacterium]|nr:RecX family transcriptional regulator [bacterium]